VSAEQQMNVSPEEAAKGMEVWNTWFSKHGSSIRDIGVPLGKGVNVTASGASQAKTQVAGYSMIEASDIEGAKAIVAEHPHFMLPGSSIEVLECLPMPGM
jgi:hypothetical protein